MSFFDEVKDSVGGVAKGVSQKAKEVSYSTKLNFSLNRKEDDLHKAYEELGKVCYETQKSELQECPQVQAIDKLKEEIAELHEKIILEKGAIMCPNCKAKMPEGTSFCSKCGAKMTE